MPNYNDNFVSADWEHKKRKHKKSKRRHDKRMNHKHCVDLANCVGWTPFYVVDEVPVYDRLETRVVPAHTEKEKAFYVIKNGHYEYTDNNGVNHYTDAYMWKETGREIFYPEKIVTRKVLTGHKKVKPYLKRFHLSNRKSFAKNMTHRLARRRFGNLKHRLVEGNLPDYIDTSKNSDHKCFDYNWFVW